jgi:integrase/recombinase XerD
MKTQTPQISFSQAVAGYMFTIQARHLSEHTVLDYQGTLKKFKAFLVEDLPIADITPRHIEGFLGSQQGLSNKTLLNYHTGLSALWTWAQKERLVPVHIVHEVIAPKPEDREIVPYTFEEVKAMLGALARSKVYRRPGKRPSDHAILFPERNRALILMLVDTGIRSEELHDAKIHQLDKRNSRLHVFGKGAKERYAPFSPQTGQALWRYLTTRPDATNGEYLFTTVLNRPFNRHRLLDLMQTIGARAGVENVTVHRFRHTFAIQYIRNGGDPYTLQKLLGHSTLDMVKRYLAIAQIDVDNAHRRASPVDNWRL